MRILFALVISQEKITIIAFGPLAKVKWTFYWIIKEYELYNYNSFLYNVYDHMYIIKIFGSPMPPLGCLLLNVIPKVFEIIICWVAVNIFVGFQFFYKLMWYSFLDIHIYYLFSDFWTIWSCGARATSPWSWDITVQGVRLCSSQWLLFMDCLEDFMFVGWYLFICSLFYSLLI